MLNFFANVLRRSLLDRYKGYRGSLRAGLYPVGPDGKLGLPTKVVELRNLILYGGSDIMARVLGGDDEYKVQAMYFEFENLADPGDLIAEPTFDRSGGLTYYQGLSSPKDYLRIPITVSPSILSSDITKYVGNQVTFFALTGGTQGVNGVAFNEASNSTVYGVGLAATPVLNDPTQDIVFARAYFPGSGSGANKFPKQVGHAIGTDWSVRFN